MFHRLGHRLLGDGVEHHALDGLAAQGALFLQRLDEMPGDRLALAIRVGGENRLVRRFDGARDIIEPLLRFGIDFPNHAEIGGGINRAVLGREVPDMAERRQHLVAAAEIFVDGLRLGRGFDDDYVHEGPYVFNFFGRVLGVLVALRAWKMGKRPPAVNCPGPCAVRNMKLGVEINK